MSDSNEDFVSFENALRDLKLQSEQLKKMVSQGDIRAFRVGDSMQFRAEDVEALRSRADGEDDLIFVDALEDDTGMVTEELSDEDTLLAEDDLEDDVETVAPARAARRPARSAPAEEESKEPGWVLAAAIVSCLVLIWGAMVLQSVSGQKDPGESFLTQMWADEDDK